MIVNFLARAKLFTINLTIDLLTTCMKYKCYTNHINFFFRKMFLRNPCKHPIIFLKDVHFKYLELLIEFMYRGEISCNEEDLSGLLRTADALQIRGLSLKSLEQKKEIEGLLFLRH